MTYRVCQYSPLQHLLQDKLTFLCLLWEKHFFLDSSKNYLGVMYCENEMIHYAVLIVTTGLK